MGYAYKLNSAQEAPRVWPKLRGETPARCRVSCTLIGGAAAEVAAGAALLRHYLLVSNTHVPDYKYKPSSRLTNRYPLQALKTSSIAYSSSFPRIFYHPLLTMNCQHLVSAIFIMYQNFWFRNLSYHAQKLVLQWNYIRNTCSGWNEAITNWFSMF